MATYKVIQDIEAEDKLVGPLTLKQFIYAGIAAICLYICFLGVTKHFPYIIVVFLPVALTAGFFAFPWGRDQPTETWALAKIRFLFKSRRRIWDQDGIKELVTITAPKQASVDYTNGLSQPEVKSRLKALADTIDSRGWVIKNVNVSLYNNTLPSTNQPVSDRLVDLSSLPQQVPTTDISAADDIMDESANPVAQNFERMIETSEQTRRQDLLQRVQKASQTQSEPVVPINYWFINRPTEPPTQVSQSNVTQQKIQVVAPGSTSESQSLRSAEATPEEEALAKQIEAQTAQPDTVNLHMHTIQPLSAQAQTTTNTPSPPVTQPPDPVILGLAHNNDRSVDSIAREINLTRQSKLPTDEIVVALH